MAIFNNNTAVSKLVNNPEIFQVEIDGESINLAEAVKIKVDFDPCVSVKWGKNDATGETETVLDTNHIEVGAVGRALAMIHVYRLASGVRSLETDTPSPFSVKEYQFATGETITVVSAPGLEKFDYTEQQVRDRLFMAGVTNIGFDQPSALFRRFVLAVERGKSADLYLEVKVDDSNMQQALLTIMTEAVYTLKKIARDDFGVPKQSISWANRLCHKGIHEVNYQEPDALLAYDLPVPAKV